MLYFKIIIQMIAILIGVLEIYNKKIKKENYKIEKLILLSISIFYAQTSNVVIVQNLALIVSILVLFIMVDVVFNRIRNKN